MRARYPDAEGVVVRDGVRVGYDVYGDADRPTVVLLTSWAIVHARQWKAQIPYLARHFRVIAIEGRGNGRADRPADESAYADAEYVADALAVLDATGTDRAVLVGLSKGAWHALQFAASASRPGGRRGRHGHPARGLRRRRLRRAEGLLRGVGQGEPALLAGRAIRTGIEVFVTQVFPEPHSSKQREDGVASGPGDRRGDPPWHTATPRRWPHRPRTTPAACAGMCGAPCSSCTGGRTRVSAGEDGRGDRPVDRRGAW